MKKTKLNLKSLSQEAYEFSKNLQNENHSLLYGLNDGKKIGTYVETLFHKYLSEKYLYEKGGSSKGLDFPEENLLADIKVTSNKLPQSSCPYKTSKQKIYGLGYNLILFVYEKKDNHLTKNCRLNIKYCTFISKERTGDYKTTHMILNMLNLKCSKEDLISFFYDINLPGDEIIYSNLADEVIKNPPKQGYLTISNALQWRLQYSRAIELDNKIEGITNYKWL